MKTTLDIPSELLDEAMRLTGTRTKREVVLRALSELNQREKMAALAEKLGDSETFMDATELAELRARETPLS